MKKGLERDVSNVPVQVLSMTVVDIKVYVLWLQVHLTYVNDEDNR